jgi:N-acetylglutamate synthase-like GNAT family acetyltransferase
MLKAHKAAAKDSKQILNILKALDLYYPGLSLNDFWVTEKGGENAAVAQLQEYAAFLFLSAVGVTEKHQKQGVAREFLNQLLKNAKKDIYLYTIIPNFFEKVGFEVCVPRSDLPPKNAYECEQCEPKKCVCMIRKVKN